MPLKLVPPRAGKSPYFYVRGTHRGVALDRSTKETVRAKARKWLLKWRDEIDRGQFSARGEPTFLDGAILYMAATGNEAFMRPLIDRIGRRLLKTIDQAFIDETAIALKPNATAATRNRQVYTPISAVLKHNGIDIKVRRPKGYKGKKRSLWLWPEQAFRFFRAADGIDPEFGLLLRFLCYTGMRLSEALHLPLANVRLAESFAFLPDSKNEDPRPIFLPPVLVAALANHPRGMERMGQTLFRFRKNGRLYNLIKGARRAAGPELERAGFHTLCHTWATWMRRYGGVDVKGLVSTGRWRDAESASRYEHVVAGEDALKAALLPTESGTPTRGEVVETSTDDTQRKALPR